MIWNALAFNFEGNLQRGLCSFILRICDSLHPCPWRHAYWIQMHLLFLEFFVVFVCFYVCLVYVLNFSFFTCLCAESSRFQCLFSFTTNNVLIFSCLQFGCSCTCFSSTYHHSWNMNLKILQNCCCTSSCTPIVNVREVKRDNITRTFSGRNVNKIKEKQQDSFKIFFLSMVFWIFAFSYMVNFVSFVAKATRTIS